MSDALRAYDPLTSENAAVVLIEHQVGLMTGDVENEILTIDGEVHLNHVVAAVGWSVRSTRRAIGPS